MRSEPKRIQARFYQAASGDEPVREWLHNLSLEDSKIVGRDIAIVEYGWPIGMPTCRPMGQGLWEVRSNLTQGRIAHVLFCLNDGHLILLHGFIKKTQKTPESELAIAWVRQKEATS